MLRNCKSYQPEIVGNMEESRKQISCTVEIEENNVNDQEINVDRKTNRVENEKSERENQTNQPAGTLNNDIINLLFGRLGEMEERLKNDSSSQLKKMKAELKEDSSSQLEKMKAELKEDSGNQLASMEKRLRETVENQTSNLEGRLKESVTEFESKLHKVVNHLENQIDKKILIVEKRLEDQINSTEEMVSETIQAIDSRVGKIQGELNEKLKENHDEIEGRIGKIQDNLEERLKKNCNIVDDKIGKIQEELRKTLSELDLSGRENTPLSVTSDKESCPSENNIVEHVCNSGPEQNSSRSWNLGPTDVALPKFGNENGQNPLKFIRDLENYYLIRSVPEHIKLFIVKNCLTGNASSWFELLNTQDTPYCEFKRKFLEHYWDKSRQGEIRAKLQNGKFNPGGHLKMADYFIQIGQLARLLDPPITPEELINLVANHFAPEIRSAIIVSKPRTCEQTVNLLKELQGSPVNPVNSMDQRDPRYRHNSVREGAGFVMNRNRETYTRGQGPNAREFSSPGQNQQSRNWNRGNVNSSQQDNANTWQRGGQGHTRGNAWENNRRPIEPNTRRPDDRRWNPQINFLNTNRRSGPYTRETGNPRRIAQDDRPFHRRDERFPGRYDYEGNEGLSDREDRQFPPGIDQDRVNRLITRQNDRPPSPNQIRNHPNQPPEN